MPHLTLEALARLVDEAPTPEEESHLTDCARCREALVGLEDQTEALAAMPKMAPPPDLWPELRTRLRREGLVARRRRRVAPSVIQIAAGLALFLAGGATGFAARGPAPEAVPVAAEPAETGPRQAADPTAPGGAATTLAAGGDVTADVERAQDAFAAALDRYMMANSTRAPDPAARLAALDDIVLTTAEALNESPADPVINSFHLTAVAQRNDLLRQLAASGEPVF
ncbi:MAG: hypothetical protein R3314_08865 [Longimicrobiales bacterium]|nr:hypothetical protein [Longimicrobiales bacterium]